MTKRRLKFKCVKGDFYATREKAVVPLLSHLLGRFVSIGKWVIGG